MYPVRVYPCICITKALPVLYYTTYYTCIIEKLNAILIVNVKNKQRTKKETKPRRSVISATLSTIEAGMDVCRYRSKTRVVIVIARMTRNFHFNDRSELRSLIFWNDYVPAFREKRAQQLFPRNTLHYRPRAYTILPYYKSVWGTGMTYNETVLYFVIFLFFS